MWRSSSAGRAAIIAILITVASVHSTASPGDHLPELPPPNSPTIITDCPLYYLPDPHSPNGPCICDTAMCPEPDCPPTETPIAVPSTFSGASSCCPTYHCVPCSEEELLAMQCRCTTVGASHVDNGSYVHYAQCRCLDEEESWDWELGCQCDVDLCRLPDLCLGNSVEVRVMDGCCERVECVECPEDSVAQMMDAEQIEAKCICRACPDKVCSENEETVIHKPGRNIPNHCCDLYDCIEKGCSINGTKYDEGDQWTIEKDTQCRCQNGIALCNKPLKMQNEDALKNCFYNGNSFSDGEVWTVDQCTNCTCHGGQSKCIAHLCMQIKETVVTHPAVLCLATHCDLQCAVYGVDVHGCHLCECKENDGVQINENGQFTWEKVDMIVNIALIIAAILVVVVATAFFILRRKCKRMRYYPETKHNLLLENNNISRDIYTSTTKPEDQIILPLYKATSIEITRN